jgi:hypothetical protein
MKQSLQIAPQGDTEELTCQETHIGEHLRLVRTAKKIDVSTAAHALRIRQDFITALENGDSKNLPERVYTLGFVRAYARFLDLNIEDTINRFKFEVLGDACNFVHCAPSPVNENTKSHMKVIMLSSFLGLCLVFGFFWFMKSDDGLEKQQVVLPMPQSVTNDIVSRIGNLDPVPKADDNIAIVKDIIIDLKRPIHALNIIEATWIEIKSIEGNILESRIFHSGEKIIATDHDLEVTVGNAGGVIAVQDDISSVLGTRSAVVKGIKIVHG